MKKENPQSIKTSSVEQKSTPTVIIIPEAERLALLASFQKSFDENIKPLWKEWDEQCPGVMFRSGARIKF